MKIWLIKHFAFSKGEFNGILFLIIILILLKATPIIYEYLNPLQPDDQSLVAQIKHIEINDQPKFNYSEDKSIDFEDNKKIKLINFDPNTINLSTWQSFGLSAKQAGSIINYRNKGGKFFKPADLQKMYTISAQLYKKLLPYIQIENQSGGFVKNTYKPYEKKEYVKKELIIVDINKADSTQFDAITGIGPAFAMRILKYRERLGGFSKKEQLMEVYGLDSIKYNEIKAQVSIGSFKLKTININTAQFNDLKTNPYLSYKQINAIIQYRKQHGNYTKLSDLRKVAILNQEVMAKIEPYLSF